MLISSIQRQYDRTVPTDSCLEITQRNQNVLNIDEQETLNAQLSTK